MNFFFPGSLRLSFTIVVSGGTELATRESGYTPSSLLSDSPRTAPPYTRKNITRLSLDSSFGWSILNKRKDLV